MNSERDDLERPELISQRPNKAKTLLPLLVVAVFALLNLTCSRQRNIDEVGSAGQRARNPAELVVQMAHLAVNLFDISSDGKSVITSGTRVSSGTGFTARKAQLWDVDAGLLVGEFDDSAGGGVRLSPDARYVLTRESTKEGHHLLVWEVETGSSKELEGTLDGANFSPDSKYLITCGDDGLVTLWELATARKVHQFKSDEHFSQADLSSEGTYVRTVNRGGIAQLWEVSTGREANRIELLPESYRSVECDLSLSKDWNYILAWDSLSPLRLFDVNTHREIQHYGIGDKHLFSAALSGDNKYVLIGTEGRAMLVDARTGRTRWQVEVGEDMVDLASFSADNNYILLGDSRTGTVALREVRSGRSLGQFETPYYVGHSAQFFADGRRALVVGRDGIARLIEVQTGKELSRLRGHSSIVTSVAFSPDGKYLLTTNLTESLDGDAASAAEAILGLWELASGGQVRQVRLKGSGFDSAGFSTNSELLVIVSADGTERHWSVETGLEVKASNVRGASVLSSQPSPRDGAATKEFRVSSPDGKYAIKGTQVEHISVFDDDDGHISLLDLKTGRAVRKFNGHSNLVSSVAFSPDGKFLATGSIDGTTRLWDLALGTELCRLITFDDGNWVVIDPANRFDGSNLEESRSMHWRKPDDPLHLIPLKSFMPEFYEPRLLTKVLQRQIPSR